MNLEALKLVLETVSQAGEGAYSLAIIYMARGYISAILAFAGCVWCLKMILNIIKSSIRVYRVLYQAVKSASHVSWNDGDMDEASEVRLLEYVRLGELTFDRRESLMQYETDSLDKQAIELKAILQIAKKRSGYSDLTEKISIMADTIKNLKETLDKKESPVDQKVNVNGG